MSQAFVRHEHDGLHYFRGGEGPTLLLLHGLPGSSHSWKSAGRLLASHYDVILPDLPGFGESQPLGTALHLDHDFYLEAYAETMHRLLANLNVEALYLAGHDFGGPVAVTLYRLFRQYTIRGLALSATNLFTDPYVPFPLRLATVPAIGTVAFRLFTGTRTGLRLLYRMAAHNRATFTIHDFERHLTDSGVEQTSRLFRRSLANLEENYRAVEETLPELDVPTLVLWGDRDPFFPIATARRLVEVLPDATTAIFEDTGHFVPEERPATTAWHVDDFFRARSASRRSRPDRRHFRGFDPPSS